MKKELKIAVCVMAVAFSIGLNITGLMPVLSLISEKYAGIDTSLIQLLHTLPYGLLIVGSLLVGRLTSRFSNKTIAIAGMVMIGAFGAFPFIVDSFAVLFVCRALIGFGFGIASPMNTAIIAQLLEPEKRAGYLGLHVIGMGIGTMSGNLLGGVLAGFGLRFYYLIFLMAFVCALLVRILLPDLPPSSADKAGRSRIGALIWILSLMAFIHTLFINAYGTNISMYIAQNVTADPQAAGLATAVNAAFAMLLGATFTKVLNTLRRATLPFAVLSAAVGYASLLFMPGIAGVLLGSALCGISMSCFNAMGAYLVSISAEPESVAAASGVYSVIGSIGGLIAPVVMGASAAAIGGNTPSNQFVIAFAGMMLLGGIISVYISKSKL